MNSDSVCVHLARHIWKATSLYAEGDIGGFDANSGSAFDIHRQGRTLVKTFTRRARAQYRGSRLEPSAAVKRSASRWSIDNQNAS